MELNSQVLQAIDSAIVDSGLSTKWTFGPLGYQKQANQSKTDFNQDNSACWCLFNSSNIQIVEKCKAIQCVERIPYQRLFSFGYILWRITYLLYGSVASLPSPSSNIEAWPYGTSLRFASLLHLGH